MNETEKRVFNKLEKHFRVLRNGWPDFLCGNSQGICGVEVKHNDKVRPNQQEMHDLLRRGGVPTYVVRLSDFRRGFPNEIQTNFSSRCDKNEYQLHLLEECRALFESIYYQDRRKQKR